SRFRSRIEQFCCLVLALQPVRCMACMRRSYALKLFEFDKTAIPAFDLSSTRGKLSQIVDPFSLFNHNPFVSAPDPRFQQVGGCSIFRSAPYTPGPRGLTEGAFCRGHILPPRQFDPRRRTS